MSPEKQLVAACLAQMLLTFGVGLVMLRRRLLAMKSGRIRPQSVALSAQRDALLQDSRASDNYNHLFELPVLFYALCALALALPLVPSWLPWCAWGFVALRLAHSLEQITTNRVMRRFALFLAGFFGWLTTCLAYGVALLG
jgi:hypothetical protein